MRSMLHNLILAPVVMAAAALATNSAMAETTFKVPFGFTAAGKSFPAGRYALVQDADGNYVTLQSKDPARSLTWILGPGAYDPTGRKVVVKFDNSGQTHVLRSIQCGSMITSQLDKKSAKVERDSAQPAGGR
ncbi:MAG: hypothetical protein WAM85_16770 [Terracidiphilus sp.]